MEGPILGLITKGRLSAHGLLWQRQTSTGSVSAMVLFASSFIPPRKQTPGQAGLADVSVLKRKPELPGRGSTAGVTPARNDS